MKIRRKTILVTGLTFLFLFGILFTISKTILINGFKELDRNEVINETKRAQDIFTYKLTLLNNKIIDWAAWDDTYNFMKGKNPGYLEANLQDSTFKDLGIDVMLFTDNEGKLVYGKEYIVEKMQEKPVPESLLKYIRNGVLHLENPEVDEQLNGVLITREGPIMVSGFSIVRNQHGGPAMGMLIFGVYLDRAEIKNLNDIIRLPADVYRYEDESLPADVKTARESLSKDAPVFAQIVSAKNIAGYGLIDDMLGKPALILRVTMDRDMYQKGLATIRYNFIFVFTIVFLIFITSLILLEKTVLSRIARLSSSMVDIGERSEASARVPEEGTDEIGCLASAINNTLAALEFSQNSLKAERNLISAVLDTVNAIVVVTDQKGIVIHVNRAFENISGFMSDDIANKYIWEIFQSTEDKEKFIDSMRLLLNGAQDSQTTLHIQTKDGPVKTIEWSNTTINNDQGHIEFIVGTGIDTTEREKALEKLKQSEENYRTLIESAPDTVFALTRNAEYISINKVGAERLGRKAEELIGKRITDVFPPSITGWMLKVLEKVYSTGMPVGPFRRETPKPTGTTWLETVLAPVKDREGNVSYVIGFARDVSAQMHAEESRKALEQQLFQAQKMEAVGTLAGGIAHDFNNMLAVIMGNAQLAELDLKEGSPGHREFKEIMKAVERAKDLTMKLLTFARKEKLNVRTIPVNGLIQDLVSILKRSVPKKIEIRTTLADDLPPVNVDVNHVLQALLNICNNACDAMPNGGVLTLESGTAAPNGKCSPEGSDINTPMCLIRISDTGAGMSPEVLQRIFDPFFTTKERGKGTGLGLSVTLGIIKNHDGCVTVDTEQGKGTTFNVYLPFSEHEVIAEEKTDKEEEIPKGSETVLIIDDEAAVLNVAKRLLRKAGYNPMTADNAATALFTFKKNRDKIALVVLDMIMPDTDAREIYSALREISPGVKVILASGHSVEGQASELLADGILGFVQKPYTLGELCKAVRRAIDGPL